ncbi:MAG: HEAT repeat domain-containing protein [Acidobacteriota bacterium]|nr:HEAT repeat domain-containing protein [Acidobacteriota bacterium]
MKEILDMMVLPGLGYSLETAIKGGLVLWGAMLVYRGLAKASASTRHGFLAVTMTGVLALTLLSPLMPALPTPDLTNPQARQSKTETELTSKIAVTPVSDVADNRAAELPTGALEEEPDLFAVTDRQNTAAPGHTETAVWKNRLSWVALAIIAAWLCGSLWLLVGVFRENLFLRRLAATAEPAGSPLLETFAACRTAVGLRRPVRLLLHEAESVPLTWGVLRPVILLPADAPDWSREMQKIVLLHELSHVKRWDYFSQSLGHLACILHWFNPFAWRAAARMRLEREKACDDRVLSLGGKASTYAETLLRISNHTHQPNHRLPTALALTEEKELKQRIKAILNPNLDRTGAGRSKAGFTMLFVFACALLLSAFKPLTTAWTPAQAGMEPEPFQEEREEPRLDDVTLQSLLDHLSSPDALTRAQAACRLGKSHEAAAVPYLIGLLSDETPIDAFECHNNREHHRHEQWWRPRHHILKTASPGESAAMALAAIGDPAVDALLDAVNHDDPVTRRNAVWALAESRARIPLEGLVDSLFAFLNDQDWAMRRASVFALGEFEVDAAEPNLRAALQDEVRQVRSEAAGALGELEQSASVDALVTALTGDEVVEVRMAAAWALGEIESEKAVPGLSASLQDPAVEVRVKSAWALGEIESNAAVPALAEALQTDSEDEVRERAAWALGEIESHKAVEALMVALEDESPKVRKLSVWALGEIEHESAVPALVSLLQDTDADVRKKAAWALGEIESKNAIDGLVAALDDESEEVRKTAVWALGEIEHRDAVPALTESLKDESLEIRKKAAWALGEIQADEAIPALIGAIEDEAPEMRNRVIWALGEIGDSSAVQALVDSLSDSEPEVSKRAAWALGEIGNSSAVEGLVGALQNADAEVRNRVAWALGEIGDASAVQGLIARLSDSEPDVSKRAAWALGEIGSSSAVEGLLGALQNANADVRKKAAWALGEIGSGSAVDGLGRALTDSDESVQKMIAWALGEIGSTSARPYLEAALDNASLELAERIHWALKEISGD